MRTLTTGILTAVLTTAALAAPAPALAAAPERVQIMTGWNPGGTANCLTSDLVDGGLALPECADDAHQVWLAEPDGTARTFTDEYGDCLAVFDGGTGVELVMSECGGNPTSSWETVELSADLVMLRNVGTGACLAADHSPEGGYAYAEERCPPIGSPATSWILG